MAKGIAVLNATNGNAVHKLLDDGNATIGDGSGLVALSGSVQLQDLVVKVAQDATDSNKYKLVDDGTETSSDNVALAIEGIKNSVADEVTATTGDAAVRRSGVDGKIDNVRNAIGLTGDGVKGQYTDADGVTQTGDIDNMNVTVSWKTNGVDARYVPDTTATMLAADIALGNQANTQSGELTQLYADVTSSINAVKGTLKGAELDTLEEIAASIDDDTSFATNIVLDIATAMDQLSGETGGDFTNTLQSVSSSIHSEIVRASADAPADGSDSTISKSSQHFLGQSIANLQAKIGLTVDGSDEDAVVKPAGAKYFDQTDELSGRDTKLDAQIKVVENALTTLTTNYTCHKLTLSNAAASTIGTEMKFDNANSDASFTLPTMTAIPSEFQSADQSGNSGKMFFLNAADAATAGDRVYAGLNGAEHNFDDGMKIYFCENGVWHSSEMLKQQ